MLVGVVYTVGYPWLKRRYAVGFDERRGFYSKEALLKLKGRRPLWIHAVSVGEVLAALPLVLAARRGGYQGPIVLSTVTTTGRMMAEKLLGDDVTLYLYYPWDTRSIVRRSLAVIDPWAYVALETELWPNWIAELSSKRIPSFLANARLSDRTFRWAKKAPFWKGMLASFSKIFVRDEEEWRRFSVLGVEKDRLIVSGDLKVDALLERRKRSDRTLFASKLALSGRERILIAGSTHEGEEEIVLEAFLRVKRVHPEARLVLVPRHPERSPVVADRAKEKAPTCFFSQISSDWSILVVDEVGVLFDFYGLASAAFVGGSLVPKGGQNPMEAACWGVPICYGPHMEDFACVSKELEDLGIARKIDGVEELACFWMKTLSSKKAEGFSTVCEAWLQKKAGAGARIWETLSHFLVDS